MHPDSNRSGSIWRAAIVLSFVTAGLLYLFLPPNPDLFDHDYSAWRLLSGDLPYHDVLDVNWPGVVVLHALSQLLFGVHLWSWRAFDYMLFIPAAWCLADLARQAAGHLGGRIALVLTPLLYVSAGYWVAGQKDMTGGMFLVVALWLHVRGYLHQSLALHAASGLCIGVAMLNKPTLGIILALLPLQALAHGHRWPRVATATALSAAACGLTLAAAAAWLFTLGTTWSDVADMLLTYPRYARSLDAAAIVRVLDKLVHMRMGGFWTLMVAACPPVWIVLWRCNAMPMAASSLAVLWLVGLISTFVQTLGHGYHLSPALLAAIGTLSIALARGVGTSGPKRRPVWLRPVAAIAIAFAALGVAYRLQLSYAGLLGAVRSGSLDSYRERFQAEAGSDLSLSDALRFIRRLEGEPDRGCLLFVGESNPFNLLARRVHPSRFYYLPTIKRAAPPLPMAQRWNELWAADLERSDCRYVLVAYPRHAEWLEGPSQAATALRKLLTRYDQVGAIGKDAAVRVYRRREG